MASFAARSVLRSAARISVGVKPRASPSPFRLPSQNPLSARIFRSPVEMSSVTVASMLPCHTATASALLTSMLSVAPRTHAWTIEGLAQSSLNGKGVFFSSCRARKDIDEGLEKEAWGDGIEEKTEETSELALACRHRRQRLFS
ncbi:hypothetical protein SASPL_124043 [Salvia splendens]|uniref:Protein NUCLEAR FUSION DEFECTIVE 6, chloroplastic/mitochondrial-like n=1 Tax=Salvia splendens TaxID=180675 RepID=A0A8X8XLH3_SALSN|nr:hypothetical protein SASPL_124043 [Salvia splendens]